MSALHRELCRTVFALQAFEHYIFGSLFLIYFYVIINPYSFSGDKKDNNLIEFSNFKYEAIITKFHNFKIIWTSVSNLAFPDILSRNVTLSEADTLQFQHKEIPHDISFYD